MRYFDKTHLPKHFLPCIFKVKTEWCRVKSWKHSCIWPVKQNLLGKIAIIFLSISLNMCFECSKEGSHRDGSFEYPQHMFWLWNKKVRHSDLGACSCPTPMWIAVWNSCHLRINPFLNPEILVASFSVFSRPCKVLCMKKCVPWSPYYLPSNLL